MKNSAPLMLVKDGGYGGITKVQVCLRSDVASQQRGNDLDTALRDREAENEQYEYTCSLT